MHPPGRNFSRSAHAGWAHQYWSHGRSRRDWNPSVRSSAPRWAVRPPSRCARTSGCLGAILGDTVREQNGEEVFDLVERARRGVVSGAALRDRPRRAGGDVRRYRHPPGRSRSSARSPTSRCWPTSPRTSTASVAAAIHVAAGEPPQDSSLAATYAKLDAADLDAGDGRRRARRRAGVAGDHRAPHRDPAAHVFDTQHRITELMRLRHAGARRTPTTVATSNRSCVATSSRCGRPR